MSAPAGSSSGLASSGAADERFPAGFAKLRGVDFEYYMQTYSIMLGRDTKNTTVDLDIAMIGGGKKISRNHARIYYDFARQRFAMDVLGKTGCIVEGVHHFPGGPPVKIDSQDLLQIGKKKFYFLLPSRSILERAIAAYQLQHNLTAQQQPDAPPPPAVGRSGGPMPLDSNDEVLEHDADAEDDEVTQQTEKISQMKLRSDRESDYLKLLQLDEEEAISSAATVLFELCGMGGWIPMEKLYAELVKQYHIVWSDNNVRKYLDSEESSQTNTEGKPWFNLLALLRKYPKHFSSNTTLKEGVETEFVSLNSWLS